MTEGGSYESWACMRGMGGSGGHGRGKKGVLVGGSLSAWE